MDPTERRTDTQTNIIEFVKRPSTSKKRGVTENQTNGRKILTLNNFDDIQLAAVRKTISTISYRFASFESYRNFEGCDCPAAIPLITESFPQLWIREDLVQGSFGKTPSSRNLPKPMKKIYPFHEYKIIPKTEGELSAKWKELQTLKSSSSFGELQTLAMEVISLNEREQAFYATVLEGLGKACFPDEMDSNEEVSEEEFVSEDEEFSNKVELPEKDGNSVTISEIEGALKNLGLNGILRDCSKKEEIHLDNMDSDRLTHKCRYVIKAAIAVSREYAKWAYVLYPEALHKETWTRQKVKDLANAQFI